MVPTACPCGKGDTRARPAREHRGRRRASDDGRRRPLPRRGDVPVRASGDGARGAAHGRLPCVGRREEGAARRAAH
eukprot:1837683-Pleurochrysis_carterae.AAC.4